MYFYYGIYVQCHIVVVISVTLSYMYRVMVCGANTHIEYFVTLLTDFYPVSHIRDDDTGYEMMIRDYE